MIDVTSVLAQCVAGAVAVSAIGVAVLGVVVLLRAFRLVRATIASREASAKVILGYAQSYAYDVRQARLPAWLRGRT